MTPDSSDYQRLLAAHEGLKQRILAWAEAVERKCWCSVAECFCAPCRDWSDQGKDGCPPNCTDECHAIAREMKEAAR